MKYPECVNTYRQKADGWCQGLGGGVNREQLFNGYEALFWHDGNVLELFKSSS